LIYLAPLSGVCFAALLCGPTASATDGPRLELRAAPAAWTVLPDLAVERQGLPLYAAACGGCFHPDTPVRMLDGATRPIVSLREGDLTAGGRVLRIVRRPIDPAALATGPGIAAWQGGLYRYRGILVTGNHAVRHDGAWRAVAEVPEARHLAGPADLAMVVNLATTGERIVAVAADGTDVTFADHDKGFELACLAAERRARSPGPGEAEGS